MLYMYAINLCLNNQIQHTEGLAQNYDGGKFLSGENDILNPIPQNLIYIIQEIYVKAP
jgi:hypothetical protein